MAIKVDKKFAIDLVQEAQKKIQGIVEQGNKKVLKQPVTPIGEPKVVREKQAPLKDNVKGTEDLDIKIKVSNEDAQKSIDDYVKLKSTGATKTVLDDFNIDKFNDKGDFLLFIDQISKKYFKQFENTKGGVRTKKETQELADLLGQDQQKFIDNFVRLRPGSTLNDAQILAAREIFVAGHKKLNTLAEAAVNGGPDALLAYKQHFALMGEYQRVLKGVQTETARALNQFKYKPRDTQFTNLTLDELNKIRLLEDLGGEEQTRILAQQYLKGNRAQRVEAVDNSKGLLTATSEAIGETFLNVILSNPVSHIKNTAGNYLTQGITALERKIASRFFRSEDGISPFEDVAAAYGKQMAREEMWSLIGKTLNTPNSSVVDKIKNIKNIEIPNQLQGDKFDTGNLGKFTARNFGIDNEGVGKAVDILGKISTLDRIPTKLLSVADNYFKNLAFREEIYAQAYRETMQEIQKGTLKSDKETASTFLANRIANPSQDATKAAYENALYVTYQTKLKNKNDVISDFGNLLIKFKSSAPGADFITNYYLPFIQTPTNILTFTLERTPGFNYVFLKKYREDLAAGGARADMAKAKMALGAMFYSTFATMGYNGFTAGSDVGLTTKGKGITKEALNLQDKTVRIPTADGVTQFNYGGLDPISQGIAMASDLGKVIHTISNEDSEGFERYLARALEFTAAMGENLSDSAYLSGVGKFMDDYQKFSNYDLQKFAKVWGANYASSFVPAIARPGTVFNWSGDGYKKLAIDTSEYVQKNLYDANLNTKYDLFGDPVNKTKGYPFARSEIKLDAIRSEFLNVNPEVTPVKQTKTFTVGAYSANLPLEADEISFLQRRSGELTKQQLEQLFNTSQYTNLNRAEKGAAIQRTIEMSRKVANDELFADPGVQDSVKPRITELLDKDALDKNKGNVLPENYFENIINQAQ
jgi:hypothetical protein